MSEKLFRCMAASYLPDPPSQIALAFSVSSCNKKQLHDKTYSDRFHDATDMQAAFLRVTSWTSACSHWLSARSHWGPTVSSSPACCRSLTGVRRQHRRGRADDDGLCNHLCAVAPTIAALAASVPRKRLLLAGLSLFVVANLATAFSPTFSAALLTRVIAGIGAATFSPTAMGAGAMLAKPERRGFALAVIVAGLTTATALGSPTGAVIGALADWRWTMAFVSALGAASFLGVWAFLPEIPLGPAITLRQRLAPLADARIGLTLATTLIAMSGIFIPIPISRWYLTARSAATPR